MTLKPLNRLSAATSAHPGSQTILVMELKTSATDAASDQLLFEPDHETFRQFVPLLMQQKPEPGA